MKKTLLTLLVIISMFCIFSAPCFAQDKVNHRTKEMNEGIWLTGTDDSKIATYQKGEQWFGKLVASNNEDAPLGIDVLRNFTFEDGQWRGEIYSIKRDQLADATIEPSSDKLIIEVSIAFFSKTLEWQIEQSEH